MRFVIGDDYYVPGLGVLAGFLITVGIGVLLRIWLFRKVFSLGEALLQRIPGIKSLYGSIRDMVRLFDASKQKEFDKTVIVPKAKITPVDMRIDQAMQFVLTAGVSAENKKQR